MISTDDSDDFFGPSPMPDVMIDIETMGLRPNAPMISLGAVAFDSRAMTLGERFYENVSLASAVAQGAVVDPDTVMWWMQQSDDARSVLRRGPLHINTVLMKFSEWLEQSTVAQNSRRVWCAGPDFDCVILGEHYRRSYIDVPWRFWNQRDYRTVRELWPNVPRAERKGLHNALDDALYQVEHLFNIRRALRGNA